MKERSEHAVPHPNANPTQKKANEHLSAKMHILPSGQTEDRTIVNNSHKLLRRKLLLRHLDFMGIRT